MSTRTEGAGSEQLSPDDLALLKAARAKLMTAQTVYGFVSEHLVVRYSLGPTDTVNDEDGTIKRLNGATHGPD